MTGHGPHTFSSTSTWAQERALNVSDVIGSVREAQRPRKTIATRPGKEGHTSPVRGEHVTGRHPRRAARSDPTAGLALLRCGGGHDVCQAVIPASDVGPGREPMLAGVQVRRLRRLAPTPMFTSVRGPQCPHAPNKISTRFLRSCPSGIVWHASNVVEAVVLVEMGSDDRELSGAVW